MKRAIGITLLAPAIAIAGAAAWASSDAVHAEAVEADVRTQVSTLTVDELRDLMAEEDIRLIDVRTAEEVAEGAIPGAEHIALNEFDPASLDLSDGREIILYCRSGRRSEIAAERLSQHTGKPVRHLSGGFQAWLEAGASTTLGLAD